MSDPLDLSDIDLSDVDPEEEHPAITAAADATIGVLRQMRDDPDGPGLDVCLALYDAIGERLDALAEETEARIEAEDDALLSDDTDDTDDTLLTDD